MKNFNDKIVVITGAGSGIGRALALGFEKQGARLALNDYNDEGLAETLSMLQRNDQDRVYSQVFDVSDEHAMFDFAETIKNQWSNAHVIINNAGISGFTEPFYSTPTSAYKKVMDINFYGVVYGTKAFLPQLVANNEGAVVNISSVFGLIGYPGATDYCASKFAVRGLTEALSVEFHQSPISIHAVHPGGIKTNITDSALNDDPDRDFDDAFLTTPPEKLAKRIIRGIQRGEPRIIYGNQSLQIWLASRFLPKRIQNRVLWNKLKGILKIDQYKQFIKGL
ncbi:SDR family NAD(P)-dependent oxidoreductase [Ekhidna sp.]|uniref:SDR family NAD(P)-dependent oxidoreductase n=1 Tax=Ekhidna sp. TaxID=2608089 RepID=UPI003CCC424F